MLFYRYMLPHVTTEAYSWADPAEAFFGFKTGVKNRLSSLTNLFTWTFSTGLSCGNNPSSEIIIELIADPFIEENSMENEKPYES